MANEADKKIIDGVLERYRAAKDNQARIEKLTTMQRCYENWKMIVANRIPGKSNLPAALTYQNIEYAVAYYMLAIMADDGIYDFQPRQFAHENPAEIMSAFADYDFDRMPEFHLIMENFFRSGKIGGTSILRTGWMLDYVQTAEKEWRITRDSFAVKQIPVENFLPDPLALSLEQCRWVVTRSYMDARDFAKTIATKEYIGISKEDAASVIEERPVNDDSFDEEGLGFYRNSAAKRKVVRIIEYFSVPENKHIVIAGNKIVMRNDRMKFTAGHKPYYPFVVWRDIVDPKSFWGYSTAEALMPFQAELQAVRNNRMDRINQLTSPMWKVKRNILNNDQSLRLYPNKIIRVDDDNDITRMDTGELNLMEDLKNEETIKAEGQFMTGITDNTAGFGYGGTATESSIMQSNVQARIRFQLKNIEETVLKPLGYHWLWNQRKFMSRKEIFYVTGKELEMNPMFMQIDYAINVRTSMSAQNQTMRQNSMLQLLPILQANPMANLEYITKELCRAFGLNPNVAIRPVRTQTSAQQIVGNGVAAMNSVPQVPQAVQGPGQPYPNAMAMSGGPDAGQPNPYDFAQQAEVSMP